MSNEEKKIGAIGKWFNQEMIALAGGFFSLFLFINTANNRLSDRMDIQSEKQDVKLEKTNSEITEVRKEVTEVRVSLAKIEGYIKSIDKNTAPQDTKRSVFNKAINCSLDTLPDSILSL